jgi:hypothetical protein
VFDWCKRFKVGRSSTEDLTWPGHPPHIMVPDTHANMDQMVQYDCCVMKRHNSAHLGISIKCVHHIVTSSGVLEGLCIIGAKEFKLQTEGSSHGYLLGTSTVVWKRGRLVFGSYCQKG